MSVVNIHTTEGRSFLWIEDRFPVAEKGAIKQSRGNIDFALSLLNQQKQGDAYMWDIRFTWSS